MMAWLEAQRALARCTTTAARSEDPAGTEARQRLAEYAEDYAGIAAAVWGQLQTGRPRLDALREPLVERYERFFTPPWIAAANSAPAPPGPGALRWQRAVAFRARQASTIAIDAGERLQAALAATGPGAPPITSLGQLHALWVECGEAAYAAAAHREDFTAAQSELLAALVELRAAGDLR